MMMKMSSQLMFDLAKRSILLMSKEPQRIEAKSVTEVLKIGMAVLTMQPVLTLHKRILRRDKMLESREMRVRKKTNKVLLRVEVSSLTKTPKMGMVLMMTQTNVHRKILRLDKMPEMRQIRKKTGEMLLRVEVSSLSKALKMGMVVMLTQTNDHRKTPRQDKTPAMRQIRKKMGKKLVRVEVSSLTKTLMMGMEVMMTQTSVHRKTLRLDKMQEMS